MYYQFKQSSFLLIGTIMALLLLSNCNNDVPGNILIVSEIFKFNPDDTTLTAEKQDFILSLIPEKGNLPKDWKFDVISFDDTSIPPSQYDDHQWTLMWPGMTKNGITYDLVSPDSVTFGWISLKKIEDPICPKLRIYVKENNDSISRAVRISLVNSQSTNVIEATELIINQKAAPDEKPFGIKIRYKGKTYTTKAHLDIKENIIFEDSEFSSVMNEINSHDDIETFIFEDEIVDYLDSDDLEERPELKNISRKIENPKHIPLRKFFSETRANEIAFAGMDKNGLGYCIMCDDKDFFDTCTYRDLYDLMASYDVIYMRDIGLNDKISSLAVAYNGDDPDACAVLTVWEDSWFNFDDRIRAKHKLTIVATKSNPRVARPDLKKVPCKGSTRSWNDMISSSSFHFGHYGRYPADH